MTNKGEMLLWLSDARGVYIPRDFANSFVARDKSVKGVSAEDWAVLESGPDSEGYWDVWADVSDNAVVTDEKGIEYSVYVDGDCWLVPKGMERSDTGDCFQWPADDDDDDDLLLCSECGGDMIITDEGVAHHVDGDGSVDHDKDADHVAIDDAGF
jgi:hypothetical protein